jgi:hypothetical protein
VLPVGSTGAPIDWRDSEHATCVFCAWSVQRSYLEEFGATTQLTDLDWRVEVSHGKFLVEEELEVDL